MNKLKLKELNVLLSIDTLQLKSKGAVCEKVDELEYITKYYSRHENNFYRLNPDKANKGTPVYKYQLFERVYNKMISEIKPDNPKITRIDFRLDSFEDNYNDYFKLNKFLILLLSVAYNITNRYESTDFLTLDKLTVRSQNRYIEIENYNKALQEPQGEVKNRLEMRTTQLDISEPIHIKQQFELWHSRLKKAITLDNINRTIDVINEFLIKRYYIEHMTGATAEKFIYKYKDTIFTSAQLESLLKEISNNNDCTSKAKRLKKANRIEFFTRKDLALYVNTINNKGKQFFAS
ncbi:MAG: hypothetical protein ACI4JA_07160 [Oscillospiraceae bacterium]